MRPSKASARCEAADPRPTAATSNDTEPFVTRRRATASGDAPVLVCLQGSRPDRDGMLLTRAEAHALRAGASRTHHQLTQHLKVVRDPRLRSV